MCSSSRSTRPASQWWFRFWRCSALLILAAWSGISSSGTTAGTTGKEHARLIVPTDKGPVAGVLMEDYAVFRGIPYADSTAGSHRWRPAQPVRAWEPPRDASGFGPVCPQPESSRRGFTVEQMSEDCLSINVVAPWPHRGQVLPVMVWVHGGAYIMGSGREALQALPSGLVQQGVVLVSFNYRLGRFGFFSHPALEREQADYVGGNFWLSDQIAALRWVNRNIIQFGGDPANVTIFGVSAGGSSVNSLAVSPEARGLVKRAIAQSGGGLFNAEKSPEQARQRGVDYVAGWDIEAGDAISHLRKLPFTAILERESGPPGFGAKIGNRLLPRSPSEAFADGELHVESYMAGSTSDEASVFGLMGFTPEVLEQRFGIKLKALRKVYDPECALSGRELVRQVQTDFIFTSGAHGMAALASRSGVDSYVYRFAYLPPSRRAGSDGVPHGGEIPYLLQTAGDGTSGEANVAHLLQSYWANFARSGDPNGQSLPVWSRVSSAYPATLVVDEPTRVVDGFRAKQLAVWFRKWADERGIALP